MENYGLAQIGLCINLKEVANNVKRLRNWTSDQRDIRLEKADREITNKALAVKNLAHRLCYDRAFCRDAGINYDNINEEDSRLIKAAIADYILNELEAKVPEYN